MREKGQTEVAKTLETPVFSRGIEILTEKSGIFYMITFVPTEDFFDRNNRQSKLRPYFWGSLLWVREHLGQPVLLLPVLLCGVVCHS